VGDVRIEPEPENAVGRKVREWAGTADELFREVVTGQPAGRLRRPLLFLLASVGIIVSLVTDDIIGLVGGGVALIAILLLAMSDQVVEL